MPTFVNIEGIGRTTLFGRTNSPLIPLFVIMERPNYRDQLPEKLSAYISLCGLRNTPERYEILDAALTLDVEGRPFSSGQVYQQYRALGGLAAKPTVYKTLDLLERASILVKIPQLIGTGIAYHFHYHFDNRVGVICTECDSLSMYKRTRLLRSLDVIAVPGHIVTGHVLYLYGLCRHCQRLSKYQLLRRQIKADKAKKRI